MSSRIAALVLSFVITPFIWVVSFPGKVFAKVDTSSSWGIGEQGGGCNCGICEQHPTRRAGGK